MQKLHYWRQPTAAEIKFGQGAIHHIELDETECIKPNGKLKKRLKHIDGLFYTIDPMYYYYLCK